MTKRNLSIALFFLVCGHCGCGNTRLTDEQYIANWREAEAAAEHHISHDGASWHFNFETVRLFRINWDTQYTDRHIISGGELNDTREPLYGVKLADAQIKQLEAAVTGSHTDQGLGLCIYPHHAFVFYNADNEIVGNIDICFLCGSFQANPKGYARNWDLLSIAELIHDAGIPLRNPEWE
jgi:hypothetical protein